MQRLHLVLIALAGFGLNLALSQVSSVSAREITIKGPDGRSITTQQNVTRDDNTINVNRSTTFPNGSTKSYSNEFTRNGDGSFNDSTNRSYERNGNTYQSTEQRSYSNGTYQDSHTFIGRNGRQSTFNNTRTCSNHECTHEEQFTGPNGKTRSVDDTISCQNSRCTRQEQYRYRNGQTRTVDYSSDRRGYGTWSGTETITNRRGQQRTFHYLRRL